MDRENQHGDFTIQAAASQRIKDVLQETESVSGAALNPRQRESCDMAAVKLSRIVSGGYNPDDWIDLAGYALLGMVDKDPDAVSAFCQQWLGVAARERERGR